MPVRLLCVGDIHLGRRPARIPSRLLERLPAADLTPAHAWARTVELALSVRVDAVLLAGDVVEHDQDFFEAFGDLERGVKALTEAGIPVLAVAGNHDVEVLPRLADAIPEFRLLGRGGQWEALGVSGAEGEAATVLGWSFPSTQVRENPLRALLGTDLAAMVTVAPDGPVQSELFQADRAVVGLLHCDVGRRVSHHAPVPQRDLIDAPLDAWFLGHIHRPDKLEGPRPLGYLGSLSGLDPTEVGPRGPWLVEVHRRGHVTTQHIPLAPLRWEKVVLQIDEGTRAGDLGSLLLQTIDRLHDGTVRPEATSGRFPLAVGCRVQISGRTDTRDLLQAALTADDPRDLLVQRDATHYFVDRCEMVTSPAITLDELARGHDPAGLLAQRILLLRRPRTDPDRRQLLEAAAEHTRATLHRREFRVLQPEPLSDEGLSGLLEAAALEALQSLLAQRSEGPTP